MSVVYNGGIYMVARSLSALVFCEDCVIEFVKGSELLLFNEIELPKVGQVDIGLGSGSFFRYEPRARIGKSVGNSC